MSVSGKISLIGGGGADISLTVLVVGFKHITYSEWILSVSAAGLLEIFILSVSVTALLIFSNCQTWLSVLCRIHRYFFELNLLPILVS